MDCTKMQNLLSPYLDQALAPEERHLVEEHLEHCSRCRRELSDLEDTIHLVGSLPNVPVPENFLAELHHKLVNIKPAQDHGLAFLGKKAGKWKYWMSVAAAAVLVFALYTAWHPAILPQEKSEQMAQEPETSFGTAASDLKEESAAPNSPQTVPTVPDQRAENGAKGAASGAKQESHAVTAQDSDGSQNAKEKIVTDNKSQQLNQEGTKRENGSEAARGKNSVFKTEAAALPQKADASQPAALQSQDKRVKKTLSFALEVAELSRAKAEISGLTEKMPGSVQKVDFSRTESSPPEENCAVIVSAGALPEVTKALESIGKMSGPTESEEDLTGKFAQAQKKLAGLQEEKKKYLDLMEQNNADQEKLVQLKTELVLLEQEIDAAAVDLEELKQMSGTVTIEIKLKEKEN